ncbi:hypothetical protein ACFVFI_02730 [Streptomyces sp. NPDC057705]|uniref:hypothetical protein n=1 Tax=Streptomyces sp. NPDC057705 TaxID=3346222 RepID=UPI00369C6B87
MPPVHVHSIGSFAAAGRTGGPGRARCRGDEDPVTGLAVVRGAPAAPDRALITAAATSPAHAVGLPGAAVSAAADDGVADVVDICARATGYCDELAPGGRLLDLSRFSWAKDVEDDEALIGAFADVLAQWTPGDGGRRGQGAGGPPRPPTRFSS